MNTIFKFKSLQIRILCLTLFAVYPALAEASVAGRMQFVAGDVQIIDATGKQRVAHKGEAVNEGETVLTAANSSAQLKLIDGGLVALRPGTQLKVVTYAFNGTEDGSESAVFSLFKGGMRAITGLIGKTNKSHYKLNTPSATIGIRGTDHEPVVVLPPLPGEEMTTPPGTYDKVNTGATSLTTEAGATFIAANQIGFAGAPNLLPVILPKMPDFYQATTTPQTKRDEKQEEKGQASSTAQTAEHQTNSSDSSSESENTAITNATDSNVIDTNAIDTSATDINGTDGSADISASLTATDADGNVLNLSEQTVTTSSGEELAIDDGTALRLAAGNNIRFLASYPQHFGDKTNTGFFIASGDGLTLSRDSDGNVDGVTYTAPDNTFRNGSGNQKNSGYHATLTQLGSTLTDLGSDADTGLSWGRWQGGQIVQTRQYFDHDASGAFGLGAFESNGNFVIGSTQTDSTTLGASSLHWIAGGNAESDHLPKILTGTASYQLVGGTQPTDQHGAEGTLSSATVDVNFNTQIVKADLAFSISGNSWGMHSNDMLLDGANFASYYTCSATCQSSVSLTKNGAAVSATGNPNAASATGNFSGALMGTGLNGIGLHYAVQENLPSSQVDSATGQTITTFSQNLIQGVAGLSGPTQDSDTPFRMVGLVNNPLDDLANFFDSGVTINAAVPSHMDGGEQPVSRVIDSSSGLSEFIGRVAVYESSSGTTTTTATGQGIPTTIKIGTAANRDASSVTFNGTTISWGRWEGGKIDIYSRDGTIKLGTVDNTNRSTHWLTSSVLTREFFKLPLTGTASYSVVGNTSPTDAKGNVGTLGAVTLNADFANAKANASINLSFNAPTNTSTWNMTTNNIPISAENGFKSDTTLNGFNGIVHTTTCTGLACGPQTVGQVEGHFLGGGQGALLTYAMMNGTLTGRGSSNPVFTPANLVNGMVIMQR